MLETVKHLESEGFDVDIVSPDLTGRVSEEKILEKVKDNTLLVSVMHVNNETGIIQPVKEIGEKLQERGILFHIDATQSCGKLVEEIRSIKYDMLSFSAHKLMGPQGVGVLVLRKIIQISSGESNFIWWAAGTRHPSGNTTCCIGCGMWKGM